MDEGGRQEKKAEAPDLRKWEHQMATLRVFDALIANTDRNKGNLLIDKDWTDVVHRSHAGVPALP